MEKRYKQGLTGLQTTAQAVAFISCADWEEAGEVTNSYAACVFFGYKPIIITKKKVKTQCTRDSIVLYKAIDEVLRGCFCNKISSIDIIYDKKVKLFGTLDDIKDDDTINFYDNMLRLEIKEKYKDIDVQLWREESNCADRKKLMQALRWENPKSGLVDDLDTISTFLELVNELAVQSAKCGKRNDDAMCDPVKEAINEAAYQKEIKAKSLYMDDDGIFDKFIEWPKDEDSGARKVNRQRLKDMLEDDVEDTDYAYDDDDTEEDGDIEEIEDIEESEDIENPYDTYKATGADIKRKLTILDLILKYADSIVKETMTSFHLLYGYAYVCCMPVEDICKELKLESDSYEKISYARNKLVYLFKETRLNTDPEKLKILIPQYIDYFEKDSAAVTDGNTAMASIVELRKLFSDEVVAASLFQEMTLDDTKYNTRGFNIVYLERNVGFTIESDKKSKVQETAQSLEEVAQMANRMFDTLSEKIVGQDFAIQKFVDAYTNSKLAGRSRKGKPAAVYLFAGPPGVGKTYLASTGAGLLNMPFRIFDMSEYAGEYASEGLVGFEKTWRSAIPGVLTTFVSENPCSVILIDEIEKANQRVQLLFLQILEGARLYDKYYEKYVNFENVIIIFTTNSGKTMYEDNEDANLSELSESEVLEALKQDESFPGELCSRFASENIIMFNHLDPYNLCNIVRKRMDGVTEDLKENYQINVTYDKRLPELFLFHSGSGVDARIASGRSAELLKDCVVSYVEDVLEKDGKLEAQELSVEIELDRQNSDIYSVFVNEEKNNILVIGERDIVKAEGDRFNIISAENANDMINIIRENEINMVVIDLFYKMDEGDEESSNALGIRSVGSECLDVIRKKAPKLPVYILDHDTYHAQDKKEILSTGVMGFYNDNTELIIQQLYIRKKLKLLMEKGQRIDYKIRYLKRNNTGVIQYYNLVLREVGTDDAELRRKAKRTKVFDFERPKMKFTDIIGAEQAKRECQHFINYIRNIDRYVLEGAEIPRGILLYGPPGTGKTSIAKALAGECDVLFLNTTGAGIRNSTNPVEELKDLFKIAYANAPAILFIDEIDVIAKERRGYESGLEMILNTLLTEMEGFQEKDPFKPVFVVAATNYNVERSSKYVNEVVIDPALVRRFDNPVYVGLPDREERRKYIQLLLEKKNYADKISEVAVDYVAEHTGGKSFAFLKRAISNMTNAAIDMQKEISDDLLTDTLETQLYGEKRENDEEYRKSVARHEAGHAYVSFMTGNQPRFITIVSRGNFGGYVSYGDGEDINNLTKDDFLNRICQALAGRAAEMVYYGESGINTGASSDLEKATDYAIRMICRFGMGSMGLLSLNPEKVLESPKGTQVLEEANSILKAQMDRAIQIINSGKSVMDHMVEVLLDKSYIQGDNLISMMEEGEQKLEKTTVSVSKPHKWYVVINGRQPGIYTSWNECQEQVKGFSSAVYRSYETKEAAEAAFRSSRIGTKNIRDKKLLYHLVDVQDIGKIINEGIQPDTGFFFHAYEKCEVEKQRRNSDTDYAYICITRAYASSHGYQIKIRKDESVNTYSYDDGMSRINWKNMEDQTEDAGREMAYCVAGEQIPFEAVSNIYVPDEAAAQKIRAILQNEGIDIAGKVIVSVNKRMFYNR